MGKEYSYQEAGKWHPDTVAYNDETELKRIGKTPHRITQIRVWSSEYIVGMEVFYDGTSAGARMGSEYYKGVVYQDLILGKGEDIKVVKGRSGDLIDQLTFKTTKGRDITFGTSKGGSKFKLKDAAGRIVKGFKIGFGGHLHSIGVFFGHKDYTKDYSKPKPVPVPVPAPMPSPFPIPTPGTSYPIPTPGTSYPAPTPVPISTPSFPTPTPAFTPSFPTPTPVYTPSYPEPTPVPSFTPVKPADPPIFNPFSSTPISVSVPSSTGATYTPSFPAPTPAPASFPMPVPVPVPVPVVPKVTQSNVGGKTHADTVQFDDYKNNKDLIAGSTSVRISELRVIHDNKFILGIEVIYEADGQTVSGGIHCGSEVSYTAVNQAVQLAYGETITGISGKHGDVIDSLTITTSTGTIYKFGGSGGKFNYSLYIPAGKTVKSFAGGVGGHLHNISCYYA